MAKSIKIRIQGISPLLMHSFPMLPIEALEKKTPLEQAELAAYRDAASRELYIPAIAIQRALIAGATYSKGKGRGSLQKNVAACVLINQERVFLGVADWELDSRPVVIPATKGRVMRHRPKLNQWEATFDLEYDELLLTEIQVRRIVDDTGSRVGILDFRPERKGPFGRFVVTLWESDHSNEKPKTK